MIGDTGLHRGRHPQRSVNPAKVIIHEMERYCMGQVFNLLRENTDITMNSLELASSFIINMSVLVVVALLGSFLFSFYYCSCTIIYALMREKVDRVSADEISIHLDTARD